MQFFLTHYKLILGIAIGALLLCGVCWIWTTRKAEADAIDAFRRVDAVTMTGSTIMQFQDRLADAHIALTKACPLNYKEYSEGSTCRRLHTAYGAYNAAAFEWNMGFKDFLNENFEKARVELRQL